MAARRTHILHLAPGALAWAALEYQSRRWSLGTTGMAAGSPEGTLRDWARAHWAAGDAVRLYDARPMYFSFDFRLPKKAAKQLDEILKLKIRQEIGLPPENLLWSAEQRKAADAPKQVDVRVTVARRDSMEDLILWRDEAGIDDLWVGADTAAIRSLIAPENGAAPVAVVNAAEGRAAIYRLAAGSPPARIRIESGEAGLAQAAQPLNGGTRRADFGPADSREAEPASALLAGLAGSRGRTLLEASAAERRLPPPALLLADFDAVIAAGAADAALSSGVASLLPERAASLELPVADLAPRLNLRWIAPLAAVSFLLLLLAHTSLARLKESSRLDLVKRANSLTAETRRLKSHEAVLKKIKADRAPVMPLLKELIEKAPEGLIVRSLSLGETGALQVAGTAQGADSPASFANDLSKSGLFENVALPEVRTLGGNDRRGVAFQLSARMKGRGRK